MAGGAMDDIMNENVDLEKIAMEELLEHLHCNEKGLSTAEAEARLQQFGPNKKGQIEAAAKRKGIDIDNFPHHFIEMSFIERSLDNR